MQGCFEGMVLNLCLDWAMQGLDLGTTANRVARLECPCRPLQTEPGYLAMVLAKNWGKLQIGSNK